MTALDIRPEGDAMIASPTAIGAPKSREARERERLIESRVRILTEIAGRYHELVDPLNGPAGVPGDGAGVSLMPRTYTASVREFERLVLWLRESDRALWWHLDGWWLSAETRTVYHCPRCGVCHQPEHVHPSRRHSGRSVTVACKRVVVWRRRSGAREGLAKEALEAMASWWSLGSEPMLPDEIRVAA